MINVRRGYDPRLKSVNGTISFTGIPNDLKCMLDWVTSN